MTFACFSAEPAEGFGFTRLDGITALYHKRSGMTHIVAEPVPEILAALAGKTLDLPALIATLDVEQNAENEAALSARLVELEAAGLVFRA
jgi:PqqD family protein of HPr-rel-A system